MINLYDNIKLVLSDYKISDAQCKGLSDILISSHLSESTYDNGLISLIKVLVERRISFPMTYDYFKGVWNLVGDSRYNFANVVVSLAKDNLLSIKRISEKEYTDNEDIYGYISGLSLVDTNYENPFMNGDIIILRSTEIFDNILDTFRTVMLYISNGEDEDTDNTEDTPIKDTDNKDVMPYKMVQEMNNLKSLVYNDFGCVFYLESFKKNDYTDLDKGVQSFFMSLNMIFDFGNGNTVNIDNKKLSDIVYQNISKGNSSVKGYDCYLADGIESDSDTDTDNINTNNNSCVYLGIDIYPKDNLVNSINYVDLFNRIYKAILDIVRISTNLETKDTILDMHTDKGNDTKED